MGCSSGVGVKLNASRYVTPSYFGKSPLTTCTQMVGYAKSQEAKRRRFVDLQDLWMDKAVSFIMSRRVQNNLKGRDYKQSAKRWRKSVGKR